MAVDAPSRARTRRARTSAADVADLDRMRAAVGAPVLKHRLLKAELGATDDVAGTVEAYVSIYGNVDSYGEIVDYGAFAKSLGTRLPVVAWSHDWATIVGKTIEAEEVPAGDPRLPAKIRANGGLRVVGQFILATQAGRDAYETVKFLGDRAEFSIGYAESSPPVRDDDGHLHLTELELHEWSPVLAGANPLTMPVAVKSEPTWDRIVVAGTPVDATIVRAVAESLERAGVMVKAPVCARDACGHSLAMHKDDDGESGACRATEKDGDDEVACKCASFMFPKGASAPMPESKGAIAAHETDKAPEDAAWDAAAEVARADGAAELRRMHAWVDSSADPDAASSYKLPHHDADGTVVWRGVAAAAGRLGQTDIPAGDVAGVRTHLGGHYGQFDKETPWAKAARLFVTIDVAGHLRTRAAAARAAKGAPDLAADWAAADDYQDVVLAFGVFCDAVYGAMYGNDMWGDDRITDPDDLAAFIAECAKQLTALLAAGAPDDDADEERPEPVVQPGTVYTDAAKYGQVLSASNKRHLQAVHDGAKAMGDSAGHDVCGIKDDEGDDGKSGGGTAADAGAGAAHARGTAPVVDEDDPVVIATAERVLVHVADGYDALRRAARRLGIDLDAPA